MKKVILIAAVGFLGLGLDSVVSACGGYGGGYSYGGYGYASYGYQSYYRPSYGYGYGYYGKAPSAFPAPSAPAIPAPSQPAPVQPSASNVTGFPAGQAPAPAPAPLPAPAPAPAPTGVAGGSQTTFPFVATPSGNQTQVPVEGRVGGN